MNILMLLKPFSDQINKYYKDGSSSTNLTLKGGFINGVQSVAGLW